MEKFQKQVLAFLRGLTVGQQIILVASIAVVGVTVWIFVRLIGGGDYKPLYTGLASADAQNLAQRLAAQNIEYQISSDGTTVLVPNDQLDKARVDVASQGPLASGRMGFELFDKPNWSGSDFSERVNYQRALEAELERTIQTMNGVEAVRVHLVLPHESLFTDRVRPAKAAVLLKLRGMRMSDQVGGSIANLVSSAWDDLTPQNVKVITTDGQVPGPGHGQSGDGTSNLADLETSMAEKVVQVLSPIVGADHVKSSVTVEYDPTSAESTQELYDPNSSVVLTSQSSQESAEDLDPSGIPGTPSNAPNTPPAGAAAVQAKNNDTTQGMRTDNKTFAVSHTSRHLIEPPGRIKRIAAAVLVDDVIGTSEEQGKTSAARRKRTPEEMKQIEDLAKAALGWDSSRGDQVSVQEVAFQVAPSEKLEAPKLPEQIRVIAERWTGQLRYVELAILFALVYFLLLNPVKKRVMGVLQSLEVHVTTGHGPALTAQAVGAQPLLGANGETLLEEMSSTNPQYQRATALKKQIATTVHANPENASRLVQGWLQENGR